MSILNFFTWNQDWQSTARVGREARCQVWCVQHSNRSKRHRAADTKHRSWVHIRLPATLAAEKQHHDASQPMRVSCFDNSGRAMITVASQLLLLVALESYHNTRLVSDNTIARTWSQKLEATATSWQSKWEAGESRIRKREHILEPRLPACIYCLLE